jgi:uncharacterized protein (DUF1015 family)
VARITAFRGVRYTEPDGADLSRLTAPPYDVISPAQRESLLARDPHNVVALELPEGPLDPAAAGNRYETGARRWRDWLDSGVLAFDEHPRIYVLAQRYQHGECEIVRRGFIAAIGLEPFSAGVVLPHERTLPKALGDRFNLTRATQANLSQVFGMYSDPERATDALIDKAMSSSPIATATDDEGVVSSLYALDDPADHEALAALLADQRVFIADGHHRYTTALAYRDERRAAAGDAASDDAAYESVMMALVNMDDPGLIVYPTHRLADAPSPLEPADLWMALAEHFDVTELGPGHAAAALDEAQVPSFIVRSRDGATRLVALRQDVDHTSAFPSGTSDAWRSLDVAVLQELILSPILDIHPDLPETLERLSFSKDAHAALKSAREHDAVFILRPTRMEQVAAVALAGETMPQKSTYFYPKLLSGLVFKSLEDSEA